MVKSHKHGRDIRAEKKHWISDHRWFAGFILLAIIFVAGDTISRFAFLKAVNGVVTSDVPRGALSVAADARERWTILPANAVDTRWWVIYAEQAMREGSWRIRETRLDNFPAGREVHWSSGTVWLLEGIARIRSSFTGGSASDEVQRATFWTGVVTLALCGALLAFLVGRRFGWGCAGFQLLLLATCFPFYEAFRAGETDHHGLLLMFAVGSVFCLAAGGAGLAMPHDSKRSRARPESRIAFALLAREDARPWFITAGLLGGAAMWVSAASMIPVLIGCALGALAAVISGRDGKSEIKACPELWRLWGQWACGGCLFFYALEYFPSRMGWRLEINHPLYAFAWLAGGDVLCRFCRKLAGGSFVERTTRDRVLLGFSLASLLVPAALILWRPDAVFLVRDPFLLTLLTDYVRELQSAWKTMQGQSAIGFIGWPVLAIAGLIILLRAGLSQSWRCLLAFAFCVSAVIQMQALAQIRWSGLALGLWSICVVLLLAAYGSGSFSGAISRPTAVCFGALAAVAILAYPQRSLAALWAARGSRPNLPQSIVPTLLLRDIAHRLIQASPQRVPVVLTDPTSATELAYFGGIRTLGTLYWENTPGMKRTSRIFASPAEVQTRDLLLEAGVTHLVIPSWDGLSTGAAHLDLLQKSGLLPETHSVSYLDRVLQGEERPLWLRPFPYPIPKAFGLEGASVRVFEFCPQQTPFEAHFFHGVYLGETGAYPDAAEHFRKALAAQPGNAAATEWLRKISVKSPEAGLSDERKLDKPQGANSTPPSPQ